MARHQSPDEDRIVSYHSTAVAIDKDKNSQSVVRWAIENLINTSPNLILIHVRVPKSQYQTSMVNETIPEINRQMFESEMAQLFVPYRGFCARKGVQAKEVILEEADVSKALLDYINTNCVNNIVVGASARNALTRRFKNPDLSSILMKSAPEFCAVYVISKGKVQTVRSASRPATNTATPPRQPPPSPASVGLPPMLQHDHPSPDQDDFVKTPFGRRGWRSAGAAIPERIPERRSVDKGSNDFMRTPGRERPLSSVKSVSNEHLLMDGFDMSMRSQRASHSRESRESFSDDIDFSGALTFGSCDISSENLEFSNTSDGPRNSISGQSTREMEAEMKRLKLELKQTMDMYSTACKEANSAKQKAQELHQWKLEEVRRFEEARLAEEAALQMAEIEKAKCKAAIEAAEAAQRLAELEAHKRRNAEMKAMKEAAEKKRALDALANNDVRYRKYTLEEIEVATEYFAENLKIGEGGYGPVYKATLDHTRVAIKVLRPGAAQGRKQFQQEVEVLSCIRHPNMVLLLGACPEYGCLVYEFMDNGSLDDRIFRRGNTPTIPWKLRFKIAAEIATALLFLHQAKPEPLVHRDLKPANILLDRNYTSKISDVGLARLVPPSVADTVTQYHMTSTAGTFCYIDPEYQQTGMLGIKSDIYSLGIMLLQIITAKPPMGLTHHVERSIEKGTFTDMLDPTVTDWPIEDALSYAKMALKCAELRRKDRPDLGSVVLPELNRLKSLGSRESSSTSNSYGLNSYSHNSNSRPRSSNTSQEGMKSNPNPGIPRRSTTTEEGGRNSNLGGAAAAAAANGVERRLVPKKLFEVEKTKQ